jgi:hypothetical protein
MITIRDAFEDFLNFYKNEEYFKTITELSKSESPNKSLLINDNKLFSCDDLAKLAINWLNNYLKDDVSKHTSVDGVGIFYNKNDLNLFFVEFKHITTNSRNKSKIRKDLKLKPLESLYMYCILPHLIDKFCTEDKKEYKGKEEEILNFLFNCPKCYFCVIEDSNPNLAHRQVNFKKDFYDVKRLHKHPFNKVEILNSKEFNYFINKLN